VTQIIAVPYKKGDRPELEANKVLTTESCIAFTFWDGDKVVCCAGATRFHPGCAEVWLTPGPDIDRYGLSLTIQTRRVLDIFQYAYKIRRLQADVLADSKVNRDFIEHYGFKPEGLMRCYDALGRDCIRYARVAA